MKVGEVPAPDDKPKQQTKSLKSAPNGLYMVDNKSIFMKSITTAIVAVIAIAGFSFAYAETAEFDVPWTGDTKGYVNPDNENEYIIVIQKDKVPMTPEELLTFKDVLTEEEYEEALEDVKVEEEVVKKIYKPDEIEFFEQMGEELAEKCATSGCKASDQELAIILADPLTFCYDGDRTSVQIQSPGSTIDPTGLVPKATDNDSGRWLDELKLNRQKCIADETLDTTIHNEYHFNKAKSYSWQKSNTIPDWRYEITLAQGIQYPTLDEHDFAENTKKVLHDVCYGTQWKNIDKVQFGCPEESLYKPTEHNYTYLGIDHKLNLYKPIEENKVWQDSQQFRSGDVSQQLQKNIKVNAERQAASSQNYGGSQ